MELDGKVVIVTGGANGIGREIALAFAREAAVVVAVDIDKDGVDGLIAEVKSRGGSGFAVRADVTERREVESVVRDAIQGFGKIDVLVNNAGFLKYGPFLEFSEDDWDRLIAVDLKGYFLFGQAVAREMVEKHGGKIINIASVGGEIGFPGACAYAAAKAGVIGLTRVMAVELAPYGINVNALSPGPTETRAMMAHMDRKRRQARIKRIPWGRLGSAEDVAKAALFLASDSSLFITGHVLHVDGGFLAAGMTT
jgi:3-oxoacyl-[acyl-carrier protein] reductase